MKNKTYSELITLPTYEERVNYLQTYNKVGADTFGNKRYLNQALYSSKEWRSFRNEIIARDNGCDLALPDYPLARRVYIHHLNPITEADILERHYCVFDPENVVCVSYDTHQLIHYNAGPVKNSSTMIERTPNDTCPWKQ